LLGYWRTHDDYQLWLKTKLISLVPEHEAEIRFYGSLIEKVYVLNLDPLKEINYCPDVFSNWTPCP